MNYQPAAFYCTDLSQRLLVVEQPQGDLFADKALIPPMVIIQQHNRSNDQVVKDGWPLGRWSAIA